MIFVAAETEWIMQLGYAQEMEYVHQMACVNVQTDTLVQHAISTPVTDYYSTVQMRVMAMVYVLGLTGAIVSLVIMETLAKRIIVLMFHLIHQRCAVVLALVYCQRNVHVEQVTMVLTATITSALVCHIMMLVYVHVVHALDQTNAVVPLNNMVKTAKSSHALELTETILLTYATVTVYVKHPIFAFVTLGILDSSVNGGTARALKESTWTLCRPNAQEVVD